MPSWSPCADRSTSARPSTSRLLINSALKDMHRKQENWSSLSLLLSRLLILSFRGTLEALQGIFYAGSDGFRAKCFEKPTPPAWGEDEVSAILDAAGGRIDGRAGNVWLLSIGIDEGKVSFTLCLHPGLTKLPALASLDQEGSLPVHAS